MNQRNRRFMILSQGSTASPPAQPTGLTATPSSTSQIDLAWTDNATDETGYYVYRATDGVSYALLDTIAADSNSYNDASITSGSTYYYKVAAYSDAGETLSAAAQANTLTFGLVAAWEPNTTNGWVDLHSTHDLTPAAGAQAPTLQASDADFEQSANQFASLADNDAFSPGDTSFTVFTRVSMESVTGGAIKTLLSKSTFPNQREWDLNCHNSDNRFEFWISADGNAVAAQAVANNFGAPSLATYYNVLAYHDHTNDLVGIQVNNGTANTAATGGASPANRTGLLCLGDENGLNRTHDGQISNAYYWSRLLTATEKTALNNGGSVVNYPF